MGPDRSRILAKEKVPGECDMVCDCGPLLEWLVELIDGHSSGFERESKACCGDLLVVAICA